MSQMTTAMGYEIASLDFLYYPVSALLWFWHKVFGLVFGPDSGWSWMLAVFGLVATVRLLFIPMQIRMKRTIMRMKELQPQMQDIRRRYRGDQARMSEEMQKLQRQAEFNPLMGCVPIFLQIPVFIALFHVIKSFGDSVGDAANYVFSATDVDSFMAARVAGVPLAVAMRSPDSMLEVFGAHGEIPSRARIIVVIGLLAIIGAIAAHVNARYVASRRVATFTEQERLMNVLALYVFPLGVLVSAPFFPLAVVGYWVSNNLLVIAQGRYLYESVRSSAGPWDVLDPEPRVAASITGRSRAVRHREMGDADSRKSFHRSAYYHYMAAGNGFARSAEPVATVLSYTAAAESARVHDQERHFASAMAKASPHIVNLAKTGGTDANVKRTVVYAALIKVLGERQFGTKGNAAREATRIQKSVNGVVGATMPISTAAVSANPSEYLWLGHIIAVSLPDPGLERRQRKSQAKMVADIGTALIAAGYNKEGVSLLSFVAQIAKESSITKSLVVIVKADALDYLKDQVSDAVKEQLEPLVVDALNGIGHSIETGVDAIGSLY
ncbi:putative OxaA family protein [Gordonia araii NBRC 100433]|uniref:Membrane protein insertase YidC n=1 Tax=Gordonia araii NBRC 100433 TaxID=1073574 RepID=G7GYA4_9ACTN|nr:membrane protein insertase YidC [Gordonia araii]NNG97423.1 membrane protein insertase YidC [Gordonia araii NBRC 100433]GAB08579.1 putative OxaA family protein [Gordonia araii NBRC 100433]